MEAEPPLPPPAPARLSDGEQQVSHSRASACLLSALIILPHNLGDAVQRPGAVLVPSQLSELSDMSWSKLLKYRQYPV